MQQLPVYRIILNPTSDLFIELIKQAREKEENSDGIMLYFDYVHSGLGLSSTLLELPKSLSSHSNVLYSHHF